MTLVRGVELAISDSGSGPAFLWGHGLTGSREGDLLLDWKRLSDTNRVVRWDARGHGHSDGATEPDDYRWNNLALDAIALADALNIERFVAGGVSMGAATALYTATYAPERVRGLVLVLPPTAYETRAAQAADYEVGAGIVEQRGMTAYVDHVNSKPTPELLRAFEDAYRITPAVGDAVLPSVLRGAAASELPSPDQVRAITSPALLMPWIGDDGHPLSTAERLAELLPDAELFVARRFRDVLTWTERVDAFLERIAKDTA